MPNPVLVIVDAQEQLFIETHVGVLLAALVKRGRW